MYKELIVYVTYWGWGCYSCDVRDDIKVVGRILQTCRNLATKKMLSAIVVSVNQEKKTGTLPHGTTEVVISAKLEIQQNW